mmetsp:Transcript_95110/g.268686  ORF Transcript_95110/g.268686 Transcript_95110/m.268686 type:complete len:145 (-) Transcript_95110:89-523(-)
MAEDEAGPSGPVIDVQTLQIQPEGAVEFRDFLDLQWYFCTDTPLQGYRWQVLYLTDTTKKRKYIDLGSTPVQDYGVGEWHLTHFQCPRFDVEGVPPDVLSQTSGLLSARLMGPANDEAMTVNMVVQLIPQADGTLLRQIFNPMD